MAEAGYIALLFSLVSAFYSTLASALGVYARRRQWVKNAEHALFAATSGVAVAAAVLLYLLLSRDFRVEYVYTHTSSYQPTLYVLSAFWAGPEGSLLLLLLLLSVITLIVIFQRSLCPASLWPHMLSTLASIQVFFTLLLTTAQNPFKACFTRPLEGAGISPVLENPSMVVHPPILFLSYATYSVPFAFTLASLIAGDIESSGLGWVRRWNLLAWLFLGLGILIGARWAYVELGWGGYWSWDPVENASLLPWLTGTAYLHSLIAQEYLGIFKRWNVMLAIANFLLCIFATFVTRGGIILSDLHGFSRRVQPVAYYLLVFITAIAAVASIFSYKHRRQLSDNHELEQLLSRESIFLLTNLLFMGLGAATFLGIVFPNLTQALSGVRVHLRSSFYNRIFAPLALIILILIGICPLLGWRKSSYKQLLRHVQQPAAGAAAFGALLFMRGVRQLLALLTFTLIVFAAINIICEFARQTLMRSRSQGETTSWAVVGLLRSHHRYWGGHLVHLSILLIAAGVTGSSLYKTEKKAALARGDLVTIQGYTLQYEDLTILNEVGKQRYVATVGVYRGQSRIATLKPEKNFHWNIQDYVTEVSIRTTFTDDLYVALDWPEKDGLAMFQINVYPLVLWIWIGGGLLLVGTFITVWPARGQSINSLQWLEEKER